MPDEGSDTGQIHVRQATTPDELYAAQRLRYDVFFKEFGAHPSPDVEAQERDFDHYDDYMDHLIVVDPDVSENNGVVGTYRLMRAEGAKRAGGFYTASQFDITPLLQSGARLLEVGRSCVLAPYRTMPVLQLLWSGIARYISEHQIDLMFGCASFHGTDPDAIKEELSLLYHNHLAHGELRPRALPDLYVDMDMIPRDQIEPRKVFMMLPPLIKGYLRVGATIGDGAVVDEQFNTTDVCIVMPTYMITDKYLKHYERTFTQPIQRNVLIRSSEEGEDD